MTRQLYRSPVLLSGESAVDWVDQDMVVAGMVVMAAQERETGLDQVEWDQDLDLDLG